MEKYKDVEMEMERGGTSFFGVILNGPLFGPIKL